MIRLPVTQEDFTMKAVLLGVFTVFGISAAFGQESIHAKTASPFPSTITSVPLLDQLAKPPIGAVKPAPVERAHQETTIIIKYGRGGRMDEHTLRFADYRLTKAKVEIRGPCYSACTIVLAYVGPELLCVAEGGTMAFHQVRSAERGEGMPLETRFLYSIYPEPIRDWIDRHGGWQKLPLNGFWTMYDRELWAAGYPKCN
jgi:hypothetical protein